MRGYSVLIVCVLCVFVLCGAAAVAVAQDVTPEVVVARAARRNANTARGKVEEVLFYYRDFESHMNEAADELSSAIESIGASNTMADTLSLPGEVPSKEDIKEEIGKLQTAVTETRNALLALVAADGDSLSNQSKEAELTKKMTEVDELYMWEAEEAAYAVTNEIPTIDAVIAKAGALKTAAEEAMVLCNATEGNLTAQVRKIDEAFAALNRVRNDIEEATRKFANNTSPETPNLNKQLTDVVTDKLTSSMNTLYFMNSMLRIAKRAAEEAKNESGALTAAAEELKEKAEGRKQKVKPAAPPATSSNKSPLAADKPLRHM